MYIPLYQITRSEVPIQCVSRLNIIRFVLLGRIYLFEYGIIAHYV